MAKKKEINFNYSIYKLPVSKFIDTKFREYALHVLQSRGIPSFYDGLTPVQRYILMNSSPSFSKTLTVVGKCIADHYAHGNSSLEKAIAKLARPFGSSSQILEGYGFFGSEVSPNPAAARYTSVRVSPIVNEMIKKYKHLIYKDPDGGYEPLWTEIPIGLLSTIVGIAVGYKTTILPRKLEDIQEYLKGNKKRLKPHFKDFKGKIKKYDKNSWLLSSYINYEGNRIQIRGIPPILKYPNVIKRLDTLFKRFESKIKIINNSNTGVIIDIVYSGKNAEEWKELQQQTEKIFSVIVREKPIFIKDEKVLVYDSVEQYLDDFKWQIKRLNYFHIKYIKEYIENELSFKKSKLYFISFILQKRRTYEEVDEYLKDSIFKSRLENMTSKKFTKSELENTRKEISHLTKELKEKKEKEKQAKKEFNDIKDPSTKRGISSKTTTSIDLFDSEDIDEVKGGIYIWNGSDILDEEEKETEE